MILGPKNIETSSWNSMSIQHSFQALLWFKIFLNIPKLIERSRLGFQTSGWECMTYLKIIFSIIETLFMFPVFVYGLKITEKQVFSIHLWQTRMHQYDRDWGFSLHPFILGCFKQKTKSSQTNDWKVQIVCIWNHFKMKNGLIKSLYIIEYQTLSALSFIKQSCWHFKS